MTNEEMIADLKQFITATISQQMSDFATKDDLANFATKDDIAGLATKDDINKLDVKIDGLREEMNDRFDEVLNVVGETLEETVESFDKKYQNHEVRLLKLEAKRA